MKKPPKSKAVRSAEAKAFDPEARTYNWPFEQQVLAEAKAAKAREKLQQSAGAVDSAVAEIVAIQNEGKQKRRSTSSCSGWSRTPTCSRPATRGSPKHSTTATSSPPSSTTQTSTTATRTAALDWAGQAKLHEVVMDELRAARARCANRALSDEAVAEALSRSFQRVDDQLRLVGAWRCGCTATVALVNRTASGPRVHVANVGDSRCVAVGSRGCERLSRDHRPTDQAEVKRIEADGGFVSRGRVGG
ncbi:unnamed protein product, partial [Prorocentrum cordatum]